jgi:hypothetical protein
MAGVLAARYLTSTNVRWQPTFCGAGIAMVYASGSLELALLEALVHLDPDLVPKDIYP